ncbi:YppG family protein [Bacillus sp. FJAT-27445]|uniref:YppG family protein n=1 Tax=Bacillus sp. FJAT-27445 TaxID=1679166 RepID=UPI0007437D05|nr:YppG family protein [Bacillus sp. FJAT-27445]
MQLNRNPARNFIPQGMPQPFVPEQHHFFPSHPVNPAMGQPYYQGGYHPGNPYQTGGVYGQHPGFYGDEGSHFLFQNPLEPVANVPQGQPTGFNPYIPMNPYPKNHLQQKQNAGVNSVLNSFKSQDGSLDINKMVNTAGQAINAVSQASALIKGLGGVFKV